MDKFPDLRATPAPAAEEAKTRDTTLKPQTMFEWNTRIQRFDCHDGDYDDDDYDDRFEELEHLKVIGVLKSLEADAYV
jgi:hypothetical protein